MKVSASQLQALTDIQRVGDPWARVRGQSQHGGWYGVMRVLERRRWIRYSTRNRNWTLTKAGHTALCGALA